MRLTSISITGLAGFSGTVSFQLSSVSLIQGDHGVGKSSLLDVMAYAFGRRPLADAGSVGVRHDPGILHGTVGRGEAVMSFDDGSSFRVVATADTTTRMIKVPDGTKWNKATPEFIDSLVNALSYDPFVFKDLAEKQRIETLLRASPITVTKEEVMAAVGDDLTKYIMGDPSLESINATYQNLYDYRRTANVAADTHAKHASELEAALPKDAVEDDGIAAKLRSEKEELEKSERDLIDAWRRQIDAAKTKEHADNNSRMATINKEINARIADLESERARRHGESNAIVGLAIDTMREQAQDSVTQHRATIHPKIESLTSEIATAEERAMRAAQDKGTQESAKKAREQESLARQDSKRIDAAMARLSALKEVVAGRLAVKGITIASPRAGLPTDICRKEKDALVPFSRWNEASKDAFCLRMAVLFHGKCGVVFVDEIGHFTDERRAALLDSCRKYALDQGMQFILGQATSGELKVVGA